MNRQICFSTNFQFLWFFDGLGKQIWVTGSISWDKVERKIPLNLRGISSQLKKHKEVLIKVQRNSARWNFTLIFCPIGTLFCLSVRCLRRFWSTLPSFSLHTYSLLASHSSSSLTHYLLAPLQLPISFLLSPSLTSSSPLFPSSLSHLLLAMVFLLSPLPPVSPLTC